MHAVSTLSLPLGGRFATYGPCALARYLQSAWCHAAAGVARATHQTADGFAARPREPDLPGAETAALSGFCGECGPGRNAPYCDSYLNDNCSLTR